MQRPSKPWSEHLYLNHAPVSSLRSSGGAVAGCTLLRMVLLCKWWPAPEAYLCRELPMGPVAGGGTQSTKS